MRTSEALSIYLPQKQAQGLIYQSGGSILLAFQRSIGDLPIQEITSEQVLEFLNIRPVSFRTWQNKCRVVRMFLEYLSDRGLMPAVRMPQRERKPDDRHSVPFVYSRAQVRNLIQASEGNQSNRSCMISGTTLRTVLLTLYGTAALPSEIFRVKRKEVDLKRNLIFLRGSGTIRSRTIPISKELRATLTSYLRSKDRRTESTANVFVSASGRPLNRYSFAGAFSRLRARAGIFRTDGSKLKPRLCDLRQSFAVHRIAAWINEGADLNRMLPALSAYMGLSDVSSTQRFLLMTPVRFKGVLNNLSPYRARKHWREDPALMRVLDSLKRGY